MTEGEDGSATEASPSRRGTWLPIVLLLGFVLQLLLIAQVLIMP